MTSFYQDQKIWLAQYTSQDLSRTLVRQYLYQHNMFKTLNSFENQDKENSKKINKSTVIKMLCINNLAVNNKKIDKDKQCKSLLVLLVQYLRGKFQQRILKQQRSDCQSQDQKHNKQFSMNGDKILPKNINGQNTIKQKNLVNTKRNDNDEKTLTQQAFYKKKQAIKNQPLKKSSNVTVNQDKKSFQARPNTAKPTVNPTHKQQNKISQIYSKLNKNTNSKTRGIEQKQIEIDPLDIKLNKVKQQKNSAIGRKSLNNNKVQTVQNQPYQSKNQINKQKQGKNDNKQLKEQKVKIEIKNQQTKEHKQIFSQRDFQKQQLNQRKQQVVEEYFDQFQEQNKLQEKLQKVQHKTFTIPQQKFINKLQQNLKQIKNEISPIKQINSSNTNQSCNQIKASKASVQVDSINLNQKIQEVKKSNENQIAYQPSQSRGAKRMLKRTGKPFTKQEDATQMIGNDVKLLPNDINPLQNQNISVQNQIQIKQQIKENKSEQVKKQFKIQSLKKQVQKLDQPATSNNVREIKLKKKVKNTEQQESKIQSKFKFDQNFVDEPLNGNKQKYLYEKFAFEKMTIKPQLKPSNANFVLQTKINYTQKPTLESGNPLASKKKNQRILSTLKAQELKKIVFQKGNHYLPKAWHQGFILSPFGQTFYGLKQIQGGPCGIIAAVQCYFLKHLLYLSKPICENDLKNQTRRQNCLMAALTEILWKSKGTSDKITLVIPTNRNFSGAKLEFTSLTEVEIQAQTFQSAYQSIWNYKSSFVGQSNHGVLIIIYSIIMTKGIQKIYSQVDMKQNPLIGHHGHCTQQLVNLFITGQASSNCFDGKKQLQENFTLHGIDKKSQFGFLTVFQTLQYIEVGKNLKNPLFPIWIISKQFHYHVIFGNHYLISQNNDCSKFDLIYFDGLYACDKFIRLTFDEVQKDQFGMVKQLGNIKNLPLIQQVLLKKWGRRKVDWNGSTKIL